MHVATLPTLTSLLSAAKCCSHFMGGGGGGVREITLIYQQQQMHRLTERRCVTEGLQGVLYVKVWFISGTIMLCLKRIGKKNKNEVIQEGKTFRKADFQATSEAPKAAQVFWPTPSFSADETLKRIGKKWSYTGGQTFRKADFKATSEAQAVCMCSDLLLTYSKFLSRWDLN